VSPQPAHLTGVLVRGRDLEEPTVSGVVDGLHHVAEVETTAVVHAEAEPGEQGEDGREGEGGTDHVPGAAPEEEG